MEFFMISLILFILVIIYSVTATKKLQKAQDLCKNVHRINQEIDKQNKELEDNNKNLIIENNQLEVQKDNLDNQIEKLNNQMSSLTKNIKETYENQKELSNQAFNNYFETLEKSYEEKTQDYNDSLKILHDSYEKKQLIILSQIENEQKKLDDIKATREAAIAAQVKEKEIKEKLAFYCLPLKTSDKHDIDLINGVKEHLTQPRILNMLIWQTYFQKPMTNLCNNVLGATTVTGIYKVTNQINGMCYIGQAVDVANRWKQHAKCGLGIDTPAGNKLYKAIEEDGIQNFSWELLEKCSREELDKKEAYYINLYQSYEYGYNSNTGNRR